MAVKSRCTNFLLRATFTLLMLPACLAQNSYCPNVETIGGTVTLQDGDMVCAPLGQGQLSTDVGSDYLVCTNGQVKRMSCNAHLRFDTDSKICNWRALATCDLPSSLPIVPTGQVPTTPQGPRVNGCQNTFTSEGYTNLAHGTYACAPVRPDDGAFFKGRLFIWCDNGEVRGPVPCRNGYTWDTSVNSCTPGPARCDLSSDVKPVVTSARPPVQTTPQPGPATTKVPTTQQPTTQRPTTQRPTTQRPTTKQPTTRRPTHPSGPCNPSSCRLPSCFCYGDTPIGTPLADTPQFLMLTFDDAVTPQAYQQYYLPLLVQNKYNLKNPTGCKARTAFYVQHDYTDYALVKKLYNDGHEIACHTVHHTLPKGDDPSDFAEMQNEIQGLRDMMMKNTNDQELVDGIVGFRAPYLRVAGNVQFDVLQSNHFLYDTSILNAKTQIGKDPLWPYTLDYVIERNECINPPCPTKPYPGFWEIPLNGIKGDNDFDCSMVDACWVGENANTATEEQWYNFFKRNFEDFFYPKKIPMPLFMHVSLFMRNHNAYTGLGRFLSDMLTTHDDIWMVTPKQVIQWMQDQRPNSEMVGQNWGCA
ncbi:chitin deacetylase 8 [Aplysia californica]|uniref:Chitin deacetylase 8 n=1 Tax=Aplysia californica TaxID=6500 RepID=A0ABM0JD03_APLCA|nr:chitin deacetylase 8 [Aplysia californica]